MIISRFFNSCASVAFFITCLIASPPASACDKTNVSHTNARAYVNLQARLWSDRDLADIRAEIDRLSERANCFEERLLKMYMIEAEAFSRDPKVALPALNLLYQNTPSDHVRYTPMMFAIVKNYARQGRASEIQTMIDRHPEIDQRILDYWTTSLALIHAHNGDLAAARATVEAFMQANAPSPNQYLTAIAVYERLNDEAAAASLVETAQNEFGGLKWPKSFPDMQGDRVDTLYQLRFDTSLYQPVATKLPVPTYPSRAAERGLEGSCKVWFDLSAEGKPANIEAECSSKEFVSESERAISKARFEPLEYKGKTYMNPGMYYPLEFSLSR